MIKKDYKAPAVTVYATDPSAALAVSLPQGGDNVDESDKTRAGDAGSLIWGDGEEE